MKLLKTVLVLLAVLLAGFSMLAQSHEADSLVTVYKKATTDKERLYLLNTIANAYLETDAATATGYANKAVALAKLKNRVYDEADAWFILGNAAIYKSRFKDALRAFSNAQVLYEQLLRNKPADNELKDALARTFGSIGVVCNRQNDYAKALEYFFRALKLHRESGRDDYAINTYNGIGVIYEAQKEYGKALEYYAKARQLQEEKKDNSLGVTLNNIGNVYCLQGRFADAFAMFEKAHVILEKDENRYYLAELYHSYGNYYRELKKNDEAKEYYNKALDIYNAADELFGASATLEALGHIAQSEGKLQQAANFYTESSAAAQKIGSNAQVRDSEKALSALYEKMGKTTLALEHYKQFTVANDSVVNTENIKALVREELNFEFERRDAQRKLQIEKKQALYDEQVKHHKLQLLFAGIFGVLLFGLVFVVYNRRQIKKTLTLQRDLAEYEQKALHLQMNPHFVFNCLGAISGFIVQNGTDSAIKYLSKFSKLMRLTLEYSKEQLIPIDKEVESLQNYLELEQLRFNQIFEFSITKDPAIEDDVAMPPLLVQPFVENAIMHGIVPKKDKGNIDVAFTVQGDCLVCTVEDNGIGISKSHELKQNSVTVHKSMALEITRKRLEVIKAYTGKYAKVEITDVVDSQGAIGGTKITLTLPVQYISDIK